MFTLKEVIEATDGELVLGSLKKRVKGVSTDTRKVGKGDLFIAIKGDKFDGHDFLLQAVKNGAVALLVEAVPHFRVGMTDRSAPGKRDGFEGAAVIKVKDTVKALGRLAQFHRRRFKVPVIAVTGSAGKTTTKEFTVAVLKKKFQVHFNKGTENNHIGVPLTLLGLKRSHEAVVLEFGTNHFGEIAWLAEISDPMVAVFTNIGASHLAGLRSPEGVFKEKATLIDFLPGTFLLPRIKFRNIGDDLF